METQLLREYERLLAEHRSSTAALARVIPALAIERLHEALPLAAALVVYGDLNEGFVPRLRIRRVLDADGVTLFDVEVGHEDPAIESLVDEVNIEVLDVLNGVTNGAYLGEHVLRP